MTNASDILRNGYDLPVRGLENGFFYPVHIVALVSISASLTCAIAVFTLSMRKNKPFFSRPKSERFVVYLAICDGFFNIFHSMDHTHYLITRTHPRPWEVCSLYSFMMFTFVMSQMICVNVIAINAFCMMFYRKNLNFGKCDHRLLLVMFGVPVVILTVSAIMDKLGPNGYFCAFDGVTGGIVLILFTTVPSLLILITNAILYICIWRKISIESKRIQNTIGKATTSAQATHQAAKTMMLFVVMFLIQWTASSVYGLWELINGKTPPMVIVLTVLLANAGGVLNGIIFAIIYKKKVQPEALNTENTNTKERTRQTNY